LTKWIKQTQRLFFNSLTPQLLGCLSLKNSSLHLSLHGNNSAALEGCSNPQKTQQVFESAMKRMWGFRFFVSEIISGVVFALFGPLHLALSLNC